MRIGPIEIPAPFVQAALAGYSDRAMRLVARRRGCPYAVTEALLDVIMVRGGKGLRKSIDICDEDHPIAGQIIGSDPQSLASAARLLHMHGYDVIDLNMACPVRKIRNRFRGGQLLRDPSRACLILKAVRDALPPGMPTTLSLRSGFDDTPASREAFFQIVEQAWALSYAAIRVHARTVAQKFHGRACWSFLRELKQQYPGRTILGSGDVFTAQDALRMLRETGVDAVWIARGAIGNPWIFRHAQALAADPAASILPPSVYEQRDALLEHFTIAMQIHGEQLAGRRMRRMGIYYARFHPDGPQVRADFIRVASLRDWRNVLSRWYAKDGPGIWPAPVAFDQPEAYDTQLLAKQPI